MFIAMNRFKIVPGKEQAFEDVWRQRESYLDSVPGFINFNLLRGPALEEHTLFASHTTWQDKATFDAWTHSDAFKKVHAQAGQTKGLYLGHPNFEGFEVVL
ncbi:MAG: antibiotic biosynthesis monooxygenase [Cycloclasticus sp.]|jgi:heme-degrading monooxygenase HmoA|nr:antibiotic biosynthesis monooxygenase [Cycloclasticus sp.]|tara:strand:- start:1950 stop:2252 length:303 start_codon:yes stop_codon:yes gene_type:complete